MRNNVIIEKYVLMFLLIVFSIWYFHTFLIDNIITSTIKDQFVTTNFNWLPTITLVLITLIFILLLWVFYRSIRNFLILQPKYEPFLLVFVIIVISTILYHNYIFGQNLFMFTDIGSDTVNVYFPRLYSFVRDFNAFDTYSFKNGLGGDNLITMLKQTLDPFNAIFLIFGAENVSYALVYVNILKITLSGLFFYLFLNTIIPCRYTAWLFSLLYAYNGFIMVWGQHYFFATSMVYFALLLYTIELYIQRKRTLPLLIALILSSISLYLLYQFLIIATIYIIFRQLYNSITLQKSFKTLFKFFGWVCVSILLMSFVHFASIYSILNSPRISFGQNIPHVVHDFFSLQNVNFYITTLGRLFGSDLTGGALDFFGWTQEFEYYQGNYYETPQIYSGFLTLLILPQIFNLKDYRKRIMAVSLFSLNIIMLIFPIFGTIFNGFQYPMYRWTYGIIAFNLILTSIVFSDLTTKNTLSKRTLTFTYVSLLSLLVIVLGFIYNRYEIEKFTYSISLIPFVLILLSTQYLLLRNMSKVQLWHKLLLFVLVSLEIIILNYDSVNNRQSIKKNKISYFDGSIAALAKIKENNPNPFYRIEKQYFSQKTNDASVQDYYGIKNYSSLNAKNYINFIKKFQLDDGNQIRHLPTRNPSFKRFEYLDLLGIHFLLSKKKENQNHFQLIDSIDGIYTYKNKKAHSLGFMYRNFISEKQMEFYSLATIDSSILTHLYVDSDCILIFQKYGISKNYDNDSALIENSRKIALEETEHFQINKFSPSKIVGEITLEKEGVLFLSILHSIGWKVTVDNQEATKYLVQGGFMGIPLEKGEHKIVLSYTTPFFRFTLGVSIFVLMVLVGGCLWHSRQKCALSIRR